MTRKKLYTVIGLLDRQRWASSYWARDPQEAETLCLKEYPNLVIAAVLHGKELVA